MLALPRSFASRRAPARRTWPHAFRLLVLLLVPCLGAGCKPKPPTGKSLIFEDLFERPGGELGADYRNTAPPGVYTLDGGALAVRGAYNHPLWLGRELPDDVVIELDAWSESPEGDIKVELFGDGQSYAKSVSYTSTGYVVIHGGWKNSLSALCRQDEHGSDRRERKDVKVVPGRRYHYVISRRGSRLEWFIDGELALELDDPAPLLGPGHRFFGVNNWQTPVRFDNLRVKSL
jgi:hypothetical protein